ncbi:MAG: DUF2726 domain-containing protein [Vitreoscilla sp.]|nr:DUF2726 domain-containing protein [Vitreoscilla sp.]
MDTLLWLLLAGVAVGGPAAWWWQRRPGAGKKPATARGKQRVNEARDTVADWPPSATRVFTATERQAHAVLTAALPGYLVLGQVPLSRFIRVPTRYSYGEWLGRVGQLSVDLMVCDAASEVLAVVEIRAAQESPRSQQRHRRVTRVLEAAGIRVLVWTEGELPSAQSVRAALLPREASGERTSAPAAGAGKAGTEEPVLRDPPPTTWYSDLDGPPAPPELPRK